MIDSNTYYPQRDGHFEELSGRTTSSELLQAHVRDARVVKPFNAIVWTRLRDAGRPAGEASASASVSACAGEDGWSKAFNNPESAGLINWPALTLTGDRASAIVQRLSSGSRHGALNTIHQRRAR